MASASKLLASHHSAQAAQSATDMVRGRWSKDESGWYNRESRRERSQSRGRNSRGATGPSDAHKDFRKENERLRKELDEARSRNGQKVVARPNAKEGPPRDGDWICGVCNFGTTRAGRSSCYRCAAPKSYSFPLGSGHVSSTAAGAAPQATATPGSTSSPSFSSPSTSAAASFSISSSPSASSNIWFPHYTVPSAAPFVVPGFAGAPAAAASTQPAAAAATVPPTGVKPLKGRLDALLEARAAVAANPLCGEAVANIDVQIVKARAELANAQPLEVALRGTLGAVASARHALQRADAKMAKCEQQVVAAVAAYEAAAADAQTCRKQLAEAEAATARTAGGHVDLRQFFSSDPGAAWAAFRSAAEARCIPGARGVDTALRARAAAAFAEMQAICALLPAQPPQTEAAAGAPAAMGAGGGSVDAATSSTVASIAVEPSTKETGAGQLLGTAGQPAGAVVPSAPSAIAPAPVVDPGAIAAAAITAALEQQRTQPPRTLDVLDGTTGANSETPVILHPSSADVPSQFEAVAAAAAHQLPSPTLPSGANAEPNELIPTLPEAECRVLRACMGEAERQAKSQAAIAAFTHHVREQHAHAAAAAALVQDGTVDASAPTATAGTIMDANSSPSADGQGGGGGAYKVTDTSTRDDAMGGGADDGVVGKRGPAAIEAARTIAAKAKARTKA